MIGPKLFFMKIFLQNPFPTKMEPVLPKHQIVYFPSKTIMMIHIMNVQMCLIVMVKVCIFWFHEFLFILLNNTIFFSIFWFHKFFLFGEGCEEDVGFEWCATKVDANGKYLRWSVCDHDACESYGKFKKWFISIYFDLNVQC